MAMDCSPSDRIEHVVLLMLEYRAFDHMFGFIDHDGMDPLTAGSYPNHIRLGDATSQAYGVQAGASYELTRDPPHSHLGAMKQMNGRRKPKMNGFVAAFAEKAAGREPIAIVHWWRLFTLVA